MTLIEKAIEMKEREIYEKLFEECAGEITDQKIHKIKSLINQLGYVNEEEIRQCYCPSDFDLMPECACDLACKECWNKEYKDD